jgi:hypothetical protein
MCQKKSVTFPGLRGIDTKEEYVCSQALDSRSSSFVQASAGVKKHGIIVLASAQIADHIAGLIKEC